MMTQALFAISSGPVITLLVNAAPSEVNATGWTSTMTTGTTTVNVIGGSGSYTYAWTRNSLVGASNCTASAPAGATTSFTFSGVPNGADAQADWLCTVTDTVSSQVAAATVSAFASSLA